MAQNNKGKRKKPSKAWLVLLAIGLGIGWIWFSWNGPPKIVDSIWLVAMACAIFYFDNSGIRLFILQRLPAGIPFRDKLSVIRHSEDKYTDLFRTLALTALLISWATPHFRVLSTGAAIVFPLLAGYRYLRHSDAIHFAEISRVRLSPTIITIFLPAMLFIIWHADNMVFNNFLWILVSAMTILIMTIFFVMTKEYRTKKSVAIYFFVCVLAFNFGALCAINSDFDFSQPQTFRVEVVNKYVSGGRTQTPMVVVSPWDGHTDTVDFATNPEEYRSVEVGDEAKIIQHEGALGMNWYYLDIEDGNEP